MSRFVRPLALVTLVAAAAATLAEDAAPATSAGTFKVDPAHSSTMFRISHLGIGAIYGTVKAPAGTIEQDASGLAKIEVTLELDKIDTGNEQRDTHLKGPDFFNAKQFPQMTFKSTGVKAGAANAYEVTGDLTIKGKTKGVTVTLTKLGEGKGMRGEQRAGYEAKFVVNRLEYGIDWNPGAVGNDVDVSIALEAVKQ